MNCVGLKNQGSVPKLLDLVMAICTPGAYQDKCEWADRVKCESGESVSSRNEALEGLRGLGGTKQLALLAQVLKDTRPVDFETGRQ